MSLPNPIKIAHTKANKQRRADKKSRRLAKLRVKRGGYRTAREARRAKAK